MAREPKDTESCYWDKSRVAEIERDSERKSVVATWAHTFEELIKNLKFEIQF
jgi:hypothetical protein